MCDSGCWARSWTCGSKSSTAACALLGRARSYYAKQLAQHAVFEASRLPLLANAIEVEHAG